MRLPEFSTLPDAIQMDKLYEDGVYIGKRNLDRQTVLLFQYHSFYVEIYYRTYRREIDHLLLSDDIGILDPYLEQINIRLKK